VLVFPAFREHEPARRRQLQPDLSVVVLDDEPMWLDEIADAVVAALAPRE
jgi:hypothetical protein